MEEHVNITVEYLRDKNREMKKDMENVAVLLRDAISKNDERMDVIFDILDKYDRTETFDDADKAIAALHADYEKKCKT